MKKLARYAGHTLAFEISIILATALLMALATSNLLPVIIALPIALILLLKSLVRVPFGKVMVLQDAGGTGLGLLPTGIRIVPWPLMAGPTLSLMPESYELTVEAPTAQPGVPVRIKLTGYCNQMLPEHSSANCHTVFIACMVKAYARTLWVQRRDLAIETAVCQAVRHYYPEDVLGQSEAFSAELTRMVKAGLAQQGMKLSGEPLAVPSLAQSALHLQNVYVQATAKAVKDRLMRQRTETLRETISALREHLTPQQTLVFYTMQHHTSGEGESDLAQLVLMRDILRDEVMAERVPPKRVIDLQPVRDDATRPNSAQHNQFRRRWTDTLASDDEQQAA